MRHLMIGGAAAILAAAALGGAPAPVRAATGSVIVVPPLAFKARTLANGLKLYAMHDPKSASVTVDVWYGVGARDDPKGRSGFAHLFEHMMFRDTRDLSADQSEALITDAGGTRNGSTLFDYTVYTTTVPANHLEQALWLEGERLSGLVIDKAGFEAERHIVEEELRQRIYAQPYGRILYVLMPKHVYRDHPYALEIGGSIADLDAATAEDARAFHEAFYRPDNATVVVSGAFDPAELDRWADRYLGAVPRPATPLVRDRSPAPEGAVAKTVTAYAPNVPAPAAVQAWHAPRATDPDFAAIQVLEAVLGQGKSSRLYRALVYDKGLASRAYVSNIPAADGGVFAPTIIVAPGKSVEDADAALGAEIARLRDVPIGAEELDRVRNQLLADALRGREVAADRAEALGGGAGLGDPAWSDHMLAAIRTLTPADLQRVACRYLADDRRVDIHYLDESRRKGGAAETPLPPRPDVGSPPQAPVLAPVALLPEAERQRPPQAGPQRPAQTPAPVSHALANGLKVVVVKSTDAPLVSMALVVGAGSGSDPEGKAGLSAMTAALVMRGAEHRSSAEVEDAIAALGASLSVKADMDGAIVSLSAPQANIAPAADVMADIVRHPAFRPEEIERQKSQATAELAEAMSQPRQIGMRLIEPLLYGDSAYGRLATGASLSSLSREDVVREHLDRWRPDNATLVITGAMDEQAAMALAQRLFGGWAAPVGAPAPATRTSPPSTHGRVIVVDLPGSGQAAVLAVLPAIARGDAAYLPLSAGNIVLSKNISQEVRVKRGLSYGGGSILVARRDGGHLLALSQTKNESAPEVADLILGEIAKFGTDPIDAETLHNRAALLAGDFGEQIETAGGLAQSLAEGVEAEARASDILGFGPGVMAATPAAVQAAARAKLKASPPDLLIVGDAGKFLDGLRKRHPNVEVLKLDDLKADPQKVR
jgi:zinc protease